MISIRSRKSTIAAACFALAIMLLAPLVFTSTHAVMAETEAGTGSASEEMTGNPGAGSPLIASEQEAIEAADAVARNQRLIPADVVISSVRASIESLLNGEAQWHIVYFAQSLPPPYLLVTLDPSDGKVRDVDNSNYLGQKEKWEKVLGPERNWSLEEKALFSRLFFENQQFGARIPSRHHLSQADASAIAYDALRRHEERLTEQEILSMEVSYSFRNDIVSRGDGCGWMVAFYTKNNQGQGPDYQVNIAADNGEIILFYPDPASRG